jgi:hypothetical protein
MSGIVATFYLISIGQPAVVTTDSSVFNQGVFDAVSKKN